MAIVITLIFAGIACIEVPQMVRQKYWRELVVFSVLLGCGYIVSLLLALGVQLPTIAEVITNAVFAILGKEN